MNTPMDSINELVVCHNCNGSGIIHTDYLVDYHKGEYGTKQHTCYLCEGSGLLTKLVRITYESYKQPKRWDKNND